MLAFSLIHQQACDLPSQRAFLQSLGHHRQAEDVLLPLWQRWQRWQRWRRRTHDLGCFSLQLGSCCHTLDGLGLKLQIKWSVTEARGRAQMATVMNQWPPLITLHFTRRNQIRSPCIDFFFFFFNPSEELRDLRLLSSDRWSRWTNGGHHSLTVVSEMTVVL